MTKSAIVQARMEPKLKKQADAILLSLGIKPTAAITLFYSQIVRQRGIPLELKIPNDETLAAFNEDLSDAKRYTNIDDMFLELDNEVAE